MELELIRALHDIRGAVPYAWLLLIAAASILLTWRLTLAICRYDHHKWMLLHGEKAMADEIRELDAALRYQAERYNALLLRYQDRDAQIRQAQLVWGRAAGKIQTAILAQAAKTEELVGDQVGQMHEVLSAAPQEG